MGACTRKSGKTFKILIIIAIFFTPYTTAYYRVEDVEYWKPDAPSWKKLTAFDFEKDGPLELGQKAGVIVRIEPYGQLKFHLIPLFLISVMKEQKKIHNWKKQMKESPFYLAPKDITRYREDYIDELTRTKRSFSETFGKEFRYHKINLAFFVLEFLIFTGISLIYLIYCVIFVKS